MDLYIANKDSVQSIYSKLLQNRVIFLHEEINSEVANRIIASLLYLENEDNSKEICVYINSIGGDLFAGLAIYDVFQFITSPIKTICVGQAKSAAADLLAAGSSGERYAFANAEIMIHNISDDITGTYEEIKEKADRMFQQNTRSAEILAKHTGQSLDKILKDCVHDKYFTAEEAIEYGIIDKILLPHSSKALLPPQNLKKTKRR